MSRLIVKSPYIKGASGKTGGYLKYIGTRENVELLEQRPGGYMEYMADRPRSHGLFGDEDGVDMDAAMGEVDHYPGNIWTHIISLKQEDAERLGYDKAAAWRNLLRAHRGEIAEAMHIPPGDFRWYAAASSRTSYHSLPRKRESSFISSLLLFAPNPLRWASARVQVRSHQRRLPAGDAPRL